MKRENGKNYPTKGALEKYERFVSFLKKHQDKLKVPADRDQLHEILSDIFENEGNQIVEELALSGNLITNHPQIRSIFEKNNLTYNVRLYLMSIYCRLIYESDHKKLSTF